MATSAGPRLTRYPTTDGKEGWAKEVGDMVMPASSDEVALWKEAARLRFEVRRLTSALLHYGRHSEWCPGLGGETTTAPCACGWEPVRAAARLGEEAGDGI